MVADLAGVRVSQSYRGHVTKAHSWLTRFRIFPNVNRHRRRRLLPSSHYKLSCLAGPEYTRPSPLPSHPGYAGGGRVPGTAKACLFLRSQPRHGDA